MDWQNFLATTSAVNQGAIKILHWLHTDIETRLDEYLQQQLLFKGNRAGWTRWEGKEGNSGLNNVMPSKEGIKAPDFK